MVLMQGKELVFSGISQQKNRLLQSVLIFRAVE